MPDVLIHAQRADILKPSRIGSHLLKERPDGATYRTPRSPQLTRQTGHVGAVTAQLIEGSPTGPHREQDS